jgi:hypothetical protein
LEETHRIPTNGDVELQVLIGGTKRSLLGKTAPPPKRPSASRRRPPPKASPKPSPRPKPSPKRSPPPSPSPPTNKAPPEEHIITVGNQKYVYDHLYTTDLAGDTYQLYYAFKNGTINVAMKAQARPSSWLAWGWCPHDDLMIHSEIAFALPCNSCSTGAEFKSKMVPNMRYTWPSFIPATLFFPEGQAQWDPDAQEMLLLFSLKWPVTGSSTVFVRFGSGPMLAGVPGAHLVTPKLGTLHDDGTMTFG